MNSSYGSLDWDSGAWIDPYESEWTYHPQPDDQTSHGGCPPTNGDNEAWVDYLTAWSLSHEHTAGSDTNATGPAYHGSAADVSSHIASAQIHQSDLDGSLCCEQSRDNVNEPLCGDTFRSPMQRSDPPGTPGMQRQRPRFEGDLYTAPWVRGEGTERAGWCSFCSTWHRLKDSAFWYAASCPGGRMRTQADIDTLTKVPHALLARH